MSALGHKRTFALQEAMSALPPKADMCGVRVSRTEVGWHQRRSLEALADS
jgi:hypothetical protein